ncbi:family 28 glycosyl hydrolase [Gongronella butleri]|nr:family 28 glycosyl hydrolase [Gongronella butleri]
MYGGSVTDLTLVNAPQWNNLIINSTDVVYSDLFIHGGSTSSNVAKNTDGWDVYRSDNVWIKDSRIFNGDDCVSFKPNSTNIYVSNLYCNGSHGISVGSLGQYPGEYDLVQNIYSYNISMNYASDGARVKVWPGNSAAMSVDLQGGGGAGLVKNVTFDTFSLTSVDYAIELTQCYGQKNATLCVEFPSKMVLQDITFKNFNGTTSGNYKNVVTTIVCSQQDVCSNIVAENINVQCPSKYGTPKNICTRVDTTLLQYTCSAS